MEHSKSRLVISLAMSVAVAAVGLVGTSSAAGASECDGPEPSPWPWLCVDDTPSSPPDEEWRHDPIGHMDALEVGTVSGRARGWTIDPDTTTPIPVPVSVYVDDRFVGAFVAGDPRPDVAAAYPASGPDHGFDVNVPFPATAGPHTMCVYAVNAGPGSTNPRVYGLGCGRWPPRVTLDRPDVSSQLESSLPPPSMLDGHVSDPATCTSGFTSSLSLPEAELGRLRGLPSAHIGIRLDPAGSDWVHMHVLAGAGLSPDQALVRFVRDPAVRWGKELSACDVRTNVRATPFQASGNSKGFVLLQRSGTSSVGVDADTVVFSKQVWGWGLTDVASFDPATFWGLVSGRTVTLTWVAE
jgi:hypothetical protein